MSESTSWTPGVAAPHYNEDSIGVVPGVPAPSCNEDCLCLPVVEPAYNVEYIGAAGVRFLPTDQELIVDYLARKLRGQSLPTDIVREGHNAYAEHPKKLVPKLGEDIEGVWFLFSQRQRKYPRGMRPSRSMVNHEGHWKATGGERPVLIGEQEIGTRRSLTFHEDTYEVGCHGRQRRAKKTASKPTNWKMVEFVCTNSCRAPAPGNKKKTAAVNPMLLNDWVLCEITDRSEEAEGDEEEQPAPDGGGGGGEPYEKHPHLPERQQQHAGGGGAGGSGTQAGQQQQGPPAGGGAASHGDQQPEPAEAAALPGYGHGHGDIFSTDVEWLTNTMCPIFD